MGGLTWDDIAKADDCEYHETVIVQWGEDKKFLIKTITISEAEEIAKTAKDGDLSGHHFMVYYISKTCYQMDKVTPLVPKENIPEFKEKAASVIVVLFRMCQELNQVPSEEDDEGND